MTAARLRATPSTCSSAAGRSSGHRSAREMPVSTRRPGAASGATRPAIGRSSCRCSASRAAAASPGASSRKPEHLGDHAAVDVGVGQQRAGPPSAASSPATPTATVVRPGAPVGPHTATSRPVPGASVAGVGGPSWPRPSVTASRRRLGVRRGRPVPPARQHAAVTASAMSAGAASAGEHVARDPSWRSRVSAGSSPGVKRPTTATPAAARRASASRSRRRSSAESSAARAVPVAGDGEQVGEVHAPPHDRDAGRRCAPGPATSEDSQPAPVTAVRTGTFTDRRARTPRRHRRDLDDEDRAVGDSVEHVATSGPSTSQGDARRSNRPRRTRRCRGRCPRRRSPTTARARARSRALPPGPRAHA